MSPLTKEAFQRRNGLWVPQKAYPGLQPIVGANQLDGVSPVAIPVIVIEDISSQAALFAGGLAPADETLVTAPPATGFPVFVSPVSRPHGYMAHFYFSTAAAAATTVTKTHTCPAGEWQRWHAIYMVSRNGTGTQTHTYKVKVNPLTGLTAAYGAGKFNYVAYQASQAINTYNGVNAYFHGDPDHGANLSPFTAVSPTDTAQVSNSVYRSGFAPIWLAPGGQIAIEIATTGGDLTDVAIWAILEVFYG